MPGSEADQIFVALEELPRQLPSLRPNFINHRPAAFLFPLFQMDGRTASVHYIVQF
jgi:hypothetical protein